MAETLQQFFFRQLFLSVEEPDWWSFGSIIIYNLLNYLILSASASMLPRHFAEMKQKLICQDQIFLSRWNYSHQDQSKSNAGMRSLWQDNDQNGFYSAFRRAETEPRFRVDLTCHASLLSCPPGRTLMQDSDKNLSLLSEHRGLFKKVAVMC